MALPLKGGKPRNPIVYESFIQVINENFKGARVKCKYCQKRLDKNASSLQDHLNVCKNYQEAARLGQIMTEFFKEYAPGNEGAVFPRLASFHRPTRWISH